jgi:AcrR family transcriptional regulator
MHEETGSRQRMIEATIDLMRRSGLSGAGINEIVRASGAPKGSVYHFFPGGKQQIAAEALTAYSRRVLDFIEAALGSRRVASAKVTALFAAFARRVEEGEFRKSCPAGTVCLDLDPELESLRSVVAHAFDSWIELMAHHFTDGARRAAESFAGLLLTSIEGAYIRARAERSSRPFKEAGTWLSKLAAVHFESGHVGQHRRRPVTA